MSRFLNKIAVWWWKGPKFFSQTNNLLGCGVVGQHLNLRPLPPQGAYFYHFLSIIPIYLSIYYRICQYISANNGIVLHFCHIRVQLLSQVDTNSWYEIRGTTVYFISDYIITFGFFKSQYWIKMNLKFLTYKINHYRFWSYR